MMSASDDLCIPACTQVTALLLEGYFELISSLRGLQQLSLLQAGAGSSSCPSCSKFLSGPSVHREVGAGAALIPIRNKKIRGILCSGPMQVVPFKNDRWESLGTPKVQICMI